MNTLPVGTWVRALVDIHDDASNREVPQHAKAGDLGHIIAYDGDEVPTIDWGVGTGSGVYDSPLPDVEVAPRHEVVAFLAESLVASLMNIASDIREETGEQVEQMFGFLVGDSLRIVPAAVLGDVSDDRTLAGVRQLAADSGADAVFTVGEGWASRNPMAGPPSKDPARMEIVMVTASGPGVNIMHVRPILGPKELGPVEALGGFTGRFSNLSGREEMN